MCLLFVILPVTELLYGGLMYLVILFIIFLFLSEFILYHFMFANVSDTYWLKNPRPALNKQIVSIADINHPNHDFSKCHTDITHDSNVFMMSTVVVIEPAMGALF